MTTADDPRDAEIARLREIRVSLLGSIDTWVEIMEETNQTLAETETERDALRDRLKQAREALGAIIKGSAGEELLSDAKRLEWINQRARAALAAINEGAP